MDDYPVMDPTPGPREPITLTREMFEPHEKRWIWCVTCGGYRSHHAKDAHEDAILWECETCRHSLSAPLFASASFGKVEGIWEWSA